MYGGGDGRDFAALVCGYWSAASVSQWHCLAMQEPGTAIGGCRAGDFSPLCACELAVDQSHGGMHDARDRAHV